MNGSKDLGVWCLDHDYSMSLEKKYSVIWRGREHTREEGRWGVSPTLLTPQTPADPMMEWSSPGKHPEPNIKNVDNTIGLSPALTLYHCHKLETQ